MEKLCRPDRPVEIAEWCKNNASELARMLKLEREWIPNHNTIRRECDNIVSKAEHEQLAREYTRQGQETEPGREVLSIDGQRLGGTGNGDDKKADYMLRVYEGQEQQVLAQVAVERKEDEIVAAPEVLKQVSVAKEVLVGDDLDTQQAISVQIVSGGGNYLWPVDK